MTSTGPGQLNFGTGSSPELQQDDMKITTSLSAVPTAMAPDAFLTSLPQSFCFTQPTFTTAGFTTAPQITPPSSSPLNMIGFPINQLTNQFVHQIPLSQITSGIQGFPINPAILTMATGHGQFLQGGNQFPPLIMNPQQPIMTNALIGSLANTINSVTPLTIPSAPLTLNNTDTAMTDVNQITEQVEGHNEINTATNITINEAFDSVAPLPVYHENTNLPENLRQANTDSSNDSESFFGGGDTTEAPLEVYEKDCECEPSTEKFVSEPLCNAFQDEDEGNSEIMRRYRRNLNSKKKKIPKENMEEEKGEKIKKECLSDDGGYCEIVTEKKVFSSIDVGDYNEDGVPIEYDEPDFVWEEYLQETGSTAVPPTAFKHVECSLQSGFVKGMKLEVPNKSSCGTYWVASVVMTCGQLLRLRYDGYVEDGTADFWCDLMTSEIHPIGWCSENKQTLQPPEAINDKVSDWKEFLMNSLTGARTAPNYLLDKTTGTTPIDQIKQGMKLEIQDSVYPNHVWLVRIIENAGGRLYLRYEGIESGSLDFWLFYLDIKLHPIGWCKENNYDYKAPDIVENSDCKCEDLEKSLEVALEEAKVQVLPIDIFKDQKEVVPHEFEKGMKLEALHPISQNQICPATVAEVIDKNFFVVEIDDLLENKKKICFSAYSNMPTIFPIHWCQWKGIRICSPRGWNKPEFNWPEYLNDFEAKAVPESCFNLINELDDDDHEFERGMKLEAVNRDNPNQICAATITKIVGHLMWIHLDNSNKMVASHVEDVYSHNLFPVGWCESNGYQLKPPRKTGLKRSTVKRVAIVQPEKSTGDEKVKNEGGMYAKIKKGEAEGSAWCPKIYFNHKCFSGPYLSKARIAELPKCVGPGPINLVMKEVLSMLISVAYKSCRVLRELQMEGPANPTMHQQVLKAKYKTKSYRAVVEICKMNSQLEDFCRQACIKLECCPNLISPHFIDDQCPENCSQLTKTKYTYYYGKKKKKIGRPPGGHSNLENGQKKCGKKKKKINMESRKTRHNSPDVDMIDDGDDDKASIDSDTRTIDSTSTTELKNKSSVKAVKASMRLKRKYIHHIPPPSDIQTRGDKRPRYSFERRTHKKILISSPYLTGQKSKSSQSTKQSHHSQHSHHAHQSFQKKNIYPVSTIKKEDILKLDKNPLEWTITNVMDFIKSTDCANLSRLFKEQIRSLVNTSIEGSNGSPTKDEVFGCFGVGRAHEDRTLSKQARVILSSSWRQSTKQQYSVYAKQWFSFCTKRKIDPFSTDTVNVIEFLTSLYNKGLKYSAINTARSALSAFVFIDRKPVGTLPVIIRFLKGVYNLRPSLPRTGVTWDVDVVLKHLITLSPVRKLSLKMLTFKLLCLMALLSGQRIQTFQLLDIRNISITKGAIRIRIGDFLKQTRRGYQQREIVLKCYPPDRRLCVVTVYKEYILRTETYRGDYTSLFLSLNKPFKPVSKDTLSRWLKTILGLSGVDTSIFVPYSVRSASTSAANRAKVPINVILKTAGWTRNTTFQQYYNKPLILEGVYGDSILRNVKHS